LQDFQACGGTRLDGRLLCAGAVRNGLKRPLPEGLENDCIAHRLGGTHPSSFTEPFDGAEQDAGGLGSICPAAMLSLQCQLHCPIPCLIRFPVLPNNSSETAISARARAC
jgi:hypothetical protein